MAEIVGAVAGVVSAVLALREIVPNGSRVSHVYSDMEKLADELRRIKSYLKDAEDKLDSSNAIKQWVSDVRILVYDAEDLIDTFLLKLRSRIHSNSFMGFANKVLTAYTAREIGSDVEPLLRKVSDFLKQLHDCQLIPTDTDHVTDLRRRYERLKDHRRTSSYDCNEYLVGLDETVRQVRDKLKMKNPDRFVISIVGMGGIGKTTLARKVYNELRKVRKFDCHGWICVSQEYDIKDLLLQLIKSMINPNARGIQELTTKELLERYLRRKLKNKSFLVVIDDVWCTEAYASLETAFPRTNKRSRVIITTRVKHVAEANNADVHSLQTLDKDESWELFCSKASLNDKSREFPSNLYSLGQEMVGKCSGLPIAIVTLGGLLSNKSGVHEWEAVKGNLWEELGKKEIEIDAILSLSYKELPDYLKLCFLYLGMFPEDSKIDVSKLIRLWEAEGLIEQDDRARSEDIAQTYFNELVERNFIQRIGEDWIGNSYCRVHDSLRDLAIKKAKEKHFFAFYGEGKTINYSTKPSERRLAMNDNAPLRYTNHSLRTLLLSWCGNEENTNYTSSLNEALESLDQRFRLLKVLDIRISGRMPRLGMEKLIHLRYLALYITEPIKLPRAIGDLKALETLSLTTTGIQYPQLPKTVVKLQNLKHLLGNFRCDGRWIGELKGLKTLDIAHYKDWCALDTVKLVKLHQLSLQPFLSNLPKGVESSTTLISKFRNLYQLRKLGLRWEFPHEILDIFRLCRDITHIKLWSRCTDLIIREFTPNLQVIELMDLEDENFEASIFSLSELPNLRALKFQVTTRSDLSFVCKRGGFAQLRTLNITLHTSDGHNGNMKLSVVKGGMPSLTALHGSPPGKLIVPDRLQKQIGRAPF